MKTADEILRERVRLKRLKDQANLMNSFARGAPGKVRAQLLREYETGRIQAWVDAFEYVDGPVKPHPHA